MIEFNKIKTYEIEFPLKDRDYYHDQIGKLLPEYNDFHLVHTCTAALEVAALTIGIQEGDEIIMPSYTFVSTANAFALRGANIIFCDVDSDMNIEIDEIEKLISNRTKAVVAVHYAGTSCDMNRLTELCNKQNIYLIEDAAQAIGSKYDGKALGTYGDLSCISFHETKNIHCYEGGMLIVNNPKLKGLVETIINEGTNRIAFREGLVTNYTWQSLGSSYNMDILRMAYLLESLKDMESVLKRRREIVNVYQSRLSGFNRIDHNGHLYFLLVKDRTDFIKYMNSYGIQCCSHYEPLHKSVGGQKFGEYHTMIGTENATHLVRLPVHVHLSDDDIEEIIKKVEEYNE